MAQLETVGGERGARPAARAIRQERGISQVQLAEATGFIQSWISHVERGTRNPTWQSPPIGSQT